MGKRKRDDVAEVCDCILAHASEWRDSCGAEYRIDAETKVFEDRIILKIGFFDELLCANVVSLADLALPSPFFVRGVHCNVKKQYVCVSVFKTSLPNLVAALRTTAPPAASKAGNCFLEIAFDVSPEDVPAVSAAVQSVLGGFDAPGDAVLSSVTRRATRYDVSVRLGGATVPLAACRAAAAHGGVLNFETGVVEVHVDKKFANI